MRHWYQILSALCIPILLIGSGCSSGDRRPPIEDRFYESPPPNHETSRTAIRAVKLPWQTWSSGYGVTGARLRSTDIVAGDTLIRSGAVPNALESYLRAAQDPSLAPDERDAAEIRIASAYLQLRQPESALRELSTYFQSIGRAESEVGPRFSLLFGYAYGMLGNVHQALAWFSRAYRESRNVLSVRQGAEFGVRSILRATPPQQYDSLNDAWSSDLFVSSMIGEETRRRALPSAIVPSTQVTGAFWELQRNAGYATANPGSSSATPDASAHSVLVMLPLSGRFSTIGESTKQGIELALLSQEATLTPVFLDTHGEPDRARQELEQSLQASRPKMILGPLLSNVSDTVLPILKAQDVPMVSLSKRSFFEVGGSVFRLGPTVESQIESLVAAVVEARIATKYAIVYPENEAGIQYRDSFSKALEVRGLRPIYVRGFPQNDDFALAQIAGELEALDVEAIFFPEALPIAGRFIANFPKGSRARLRLLGPATWDDPIALAQSRGLLDRAIFVSPFFSDSDRPVVRKFIEAFTQHYQKAPDFMAAQGFDAATLVLSVMRRDPNPQSVANTFRLVSGYDGLTGEMQVLSSGEIQRRFAVVEMRSGKRIEVTPRSESYVATGGEINNAQ